MLFLIYLYTYIFIMSAYFWLLHNYSLIMVITSSNLLQSKLCIDLIVCKLQSLIHS